MANDNVKSYDLIFTSTDCDTNLRAAAEFIAGKIGGSVTSDAVSDSGYSSYVTVPGTSNFALHFKRSDDYKSYVYYCYKTTADTWYDITSWGSAHMFNKAERGVRVSVKTLNGLTLYTIYTLGGSNYSASKWFTAASVSMIDYFTMKSREGFLYVDDSDEIKVYVYDDELSKYYTHTRSTVGGTTFPARNQSVAAPIVFGSNDFYGYVEKSTFLYKVFLGSSEANVDLDVQIKISGHTFEQIAKNFFVRLD